VYAEYQHYRGQLPDAATLATMEPPLDTRVYARDGTLIKIFNDQGFYHEHAAIKDVSSFAKLATIDTEDRHFYEEGSWDLPRIIKAGVDDLRHNGNTQGASTITEQLAKISFLGTQGRTYDRKIKQFILGVEIENNFSKDQILEMYLNRVDYGNHAIGIESAAEAYFHTTARELDLAQASMLAGLPNDPYVLNPLIHTVDQDVNPLAKQRQHTVLQAMVTNGHISQARANAAFAEKLDLHSYAELDPGLDVNYVDYVQQWLQDRYGSAYIKPGGWEITTSLIPSVQALAQQTVRDQVVKVRDQFNAHDGALVSMNPQNGEVYAIVGTFDPKDPYEGQVNMALQRIQPGSTIKLFTYTAALASHEYTMSTVIPDEGVRLKLDDSTYYAPKNYDRLNHGACPLAKCLGESFNVPAVEVEARVGIPMITDLEIAAGITSLKEPGNRPTPHQYAATLGGIYHGISPLELADGASTIAALGVHHDAAPVLKIVSRSDGRVIYTHDAKSESRRVVPENAAFIINEITSNDRNRTPEFPANSDLVLSDRRASAKTGTGENFISNWTVGWTPQLTTVVYVGNPDPSCLGDPSKVTPAMLKRLPAGTSLQDPLGPDDVKALGLKPVSPNCGPLNRNAIGLTGAGPIWHQFMEAALKGQPKEWYTKPPDVISYGGGDDGTFYLPGTASNSGCYYYGPQPDPSNPCTWLGQAAPKKPAASPSPAPGPGGAPQPAPPPPPPVPPQKPPHS
jgi:membrane peptidoglycan carboxypeptidase